MSDREEYYARIEKITGNFLFDKTIGVYNSSFVYKAVELLASCGLLGYTFVDADSTSPGILPKTSYDDFNALLVDKLKKHNQFEERWQFRRGSMIGSEQLILAGGTFEECQLACIEANQKGIPAIVGVLLKNGISAISVVWPGEELPFCEYQHDFASVNKSNYFNWIDVNNQMANIAKAILLEGTSWQRSDVMSLLQSGKNTILLSHPQWPWFGRWFNLRKGNEKQCFDDIVKNCNAKAHIENGAKKKTVMIVGLGSLGSVIANHFFAQGCNIVGIDGKGVSIHNPVRQLYSTEDIGKEKAFALVHIFAQKKEDCKETKSENCVSFASPDHCYVGLKGEIHDSRSGTDEFALVLEEYSPDLVVLATAHPAEYRIADLCRQKNIPHIIGRCYNRARWFEVTVVDGNQGPCFGCLQGHLYNGKPPSLTEEQLARYDVSGDEANAVQAEPATMVDTARCTDVMARFGMQLLLSKAERKEWFRRMLCEERTCLIGGNYAEFHSDTNDWSFGVTAPGGVALYGVINFVGSETEETKTCLYCGKTHEVLIKRKKFTE